MWVGGQCQALPALHPGKTRYPLYRRMDGPQDCSEQVGKILLPSVFDPQTVQPVASHYTNWAIPARDLQYKLEFWITLNNKVTFWKIISCLAPILHIFWNRWINIYYSLLEWQYKGTKDLLCCAHCSYIYNGFPFCYRHVRCLQVKMSTAIMCALTMERWSVSEGGQGTCVMSQFAGRAVTLCKATVNDQANVSVNLVWWLKLFTFLLGKSIILWTLMHTHVDFFIYLFVCILHIITNDKAHIKRDTKLKFIVHGI
jgi:hypothetical protein